MFADERPTNLRCEWRVNPSGVSDACPEFYWEVKEQSAFQIVIMTPASQGGDYDVVWDSDKIESTLPIVEYGGDRLKNQVVYYWQLRVWDKSGQKLPAAPLQQFSMNVQSLAHHLPSVRTFINYVGRPEFARDNIDLSFRKDAKQGRGDIITLKPERLSVMRVPHPSSNRSMNERAQALADFCVEQGLTKEGIHEDMFCHFSEDVVKRLYVGAQRASSPIETRLCPGWDPRNDRNGDGRVDDKEFGRLVNPKARARVAREARAPIFYFGPPVDYFVLNVGHPAYQEFMAEIYTPELVREYDGIYFDNVSPELVKLVPRGKILEYPDTEEGKGRWINDLQRLMGRIKLRQPDKLIITNVWEGRPLVVDGRETEGWLNLTKTEVSWRRSINKAVEFDRRGKIHLIQYNPIFDAELSEFGQKVPVSKDRDKIYGLASYLLAQGDYTYFGFGRHPYFEAVKLWFDGIKCDIGEPTGGFEIYEEFEIKSGGEDLLTNGSFELTDRDGRSMGWSISKPIELDRQVKIHGEQSVRLASSDMKLNLSGRQSVTLKPNTSYTLSAMIKTEEVIGGGLFYQRYFDDATGQRTLSRKGTQDWHDVRLIFKTGTDVEGRIYFRLFQSTGTVWLDNIRLREGEIFIERVYGRQFSKGLVLVKPRINLNRSYGEETASTHKLPGRFRVLAADGSLGAAVEQVTLRSGEAVILIK